MVARRLGRATGHGRRLPGPVVRVDAGDAGLMLLLGMLLLVFARHVRQSFGLSPIWKSAIPSRALTMAE